MPSDILSFLLFGRLRAPLFVHDLDNDAVVFVRLGQRDTLSNFDLNLVLFLLKVALSDCTLFDLRIHSFHAFLRLVILLRLNMKQYVTFPVRSDVWLLIHFVSILVIILNWSTIHVPPNVETALLFALGIQLLGRE